MAPSYSYFSFQENFDHTTTDIRITLSFNILQVWSIPKNRDSRISLKNDAFQCGITIVFGKRAELSYFCPFRTWLIMCIHIRRAMPWAKETIGLSARLCLFGY